MYKKQKGFTLVEMIIVTVIIGILAGTVITVINIPLIQARSRDSRRTGDLKRIQTALELYFSDHRSYPTSASWQLVSAIHTSEYLQSYLSSVPEDPRVGESSSLACFGTTVQNYNYYYRSNNGAVYVLGAIFEDSSRNTENLCTAEYTPNCDVSSGYDCHSDAHCYCLQNPL